MGTIKTGLNANTPDRIFVDAGAIYINYGLASERLLGATRGGNEFNLNRVIRDIEVDGVKGSTKGLRRVTEVKPQITCNLIELSLDNLLKAIAGSDQDASDYQAIVSAEYLKEGDDVAITGIANDNIVENSESVFLDAVQLTRSAKYDSRFVGDNAVNNKGLESGIGDWTSPAALDGEEIVVGGQTGNCMKFTAGATSAVLFLKLPGGAGAQLTNLVVGEHYRLQVAFTKLAGTFTPATVTIKCTGGPASENLAPTAAWVTHVLEFIATGTDASIEITAIGAPTAADVFYIDSLELEKVDGDYVMNWDVGEVIYAQDDIPAAGEELTIDYTHKSGATVTHDEISGGDIADADYIDNVALVGTISGKDEAVICMIYNVLADTGLSLATSSRDEAVPTVVFTGHYDPDTPTVEPWKVFYPRT